MQNKRNLSAGRLPAATSGFILAWMLFLALAAIPARADIGDPVKGCGRITGGVECPTFVLDDGPMYLLSNLSGYPPESRVYVDGVIGGDCHELCLFIIPVPCATVTTIYLCDPPPPVPFEGCGTITGGEACPTFLADEGTLYFVSNLGGFEPGTRVFVKGVLGNSCTPACDLAAPCIDVETIGRCAEQENFSGCGELVQRTTCVMFAADSGGTFVLDAFGGFGVGDRVHLTGTLDRACATPCLEGDGCILTATIVRCGRDAGDFDGSDCTNIEDFLFLLDYWQQMVEGTPVTLDDFLALLDNWQTGDAC